MSLIIGENSYISLEEANLIIKGLYYKPSDASVISMWEGLSNETKSLAIINSTNEVDGCTYYRGCKVSNSQTLQFPRIINGVNTECPLEIKKAIMEQCVNNLTEDDSEFSDLVSHGITSFADGGGLSVHFSSDYVDKVTNTNSISSDIINKYLSKYTILV